MKQCFNPRARLSCFLIMFAVCASLLPVRAPAFAFATGEPASLVLGQSLFTSLLANLTSSGMHAPAGIAIDSASGRVFVADRSNNRVLRFASAAALQSGADADGVFGESDFTTNSLPILPSASRMNSPSGVAVDGAGRLWVADTGNNRVLRFDAAASAASGTAASAVLGQADFTTIGLPLFPSATRMSAPSGVAVDSAGRLWVADTGNNRVLRFDGAATKANGAAANGVLGAADFTTISLPIVPSASRMNSPSGVAVDVAGRLWVADTGNNRVLRFDTAASAANGAAAAGVLGEADFTTISLPLLTSASRTSAPAGLVVDGNGRLWVADTGNNRILRFDAAAAKANGAAAESVLGQPDLTTSTILSLPTAGSASAPRGVALDSDNNLWVADTLNNRALRFDRLVAPLLTWSAPAAITYGTALSATQLNATASVAGTFSYNPPLGTVLNAGTNQTLSVTFTPSNLIDFSITTKTVGIDVLQAAQSITFGALANRVYGSADVSLSATASSGLPVSFSRVSGPATVTGNAVHITGAGTVVVRAAQTGGTNYLAALPIDQTFTVTPAPLTITADNQAMTLGGTLPTLTAHYAGFVNGEDATILDTPVSLSTNATVNSPAGIYAITPSLAVDANYLITFVPGILTVTPKLLPSITWANPAPITYGAALSATQLNATAGISGTFSYSPPLGTVLQAGNNQTLSVSFSPGDGLTYASVTLQVPIDVHPAALTITARNASKVYGANLPSFSATASGLVNGDALLSLASPLQLRTTATAASPVGTYAINATASDANYTITVVTGTLTITPAPLTITADNQVMQLGASLPTLTAHYSGFVNGDDISSLDAPLTLATSATASSPAGTYAITPSLAAGANYLITFVAGLLTITPKLVPTITWPNPAAITYGTALSSAQLNATASIPGTFSYTPALGTVLHAGTNQTLSMNFTPLDLVAYASVTSQVPINVYPAPLTITVQNASKVYGAPLPSFDINANGLVNGDVLATLDVPASTSTLATAGSAVGTYALSVAAADADYAMNLVDGLLTVTPAPLTITADDQVVQLGASLPALTAHYNGFVNGDGVGSLDVPVALTTNATVNSPAGTYAITPSLAVDGNYLISFVSGILTITPQLVPTLGWVNPAAITYGTALSGTQLNATASVPGTFSYTPAAGAMLHAGNNQTLSAHFTPIDGVTYAAVTFQVPIDVLPAPLTIAAQNASKVYGAALPTLGAQASGLVNGDTLASLDAPVQLSTAATAASSVGAYAIGVVAADADYAISLVGGVLTVTPAPLTITADNQTVRVGAQLPQLTASYSGFVNGDSISSLDVPVTLSTSATVNSPVGTYAIVASGASDLNYQIALLDGTLTITSKLTPTITWNNPAAIAYGTALSGTQLNATANVPGTFAYTPALGATLHGGADQALSAHFTPNDSGTYSSVDTIVKITVTRASQTLAFGALTTRKVDDSPFTITATASSGLAVAFSSQTMSVCRVQGSIVTLVAMGTCTITASQVGNNDYQAASAVAQSFAVRAAHQIWVPAIQRQ